ncbi:DUF3043 domain-containing protein [Nocardioides sp. LHG3406-4]|uniref:DUF3043 domain-containing protein n=1 Tax=Nocardioides sp. LHG3406-4 TaxID=2804575 RepID=UPI003CEE01C7
MFRRSKPEPVPAGSASPGGSDDAAARGRKGRPTPTRKEAEAAARARAKTPRTRKEMAAAQRAARSESSQKMRAAMKGGDDRYLPNRDKGPERRFIRDLVDARFSLIELMIPLMLATLVLGYSNNAYLASIGNVVLLGTLLLVVIDIIFLRLRLRRELTRRFPGSPTNGTTYYAVMRALQMKFMRLPKAQVKIGQELPEHYR